MPRPIRRHGPNSLHSPAGPAMLPVVELEITRGRARNNVRKIEGLAYLIGASDDNDLVLGDAQFPDSYCYLLRSTLGLTLCWLGEGPEITIDGRPVLSSALVRNGARLRTGPYEFRIRVAWPKPAETEPVEPGDEGASAGENSAAEWMHERESSPRLLQLPAPDSESGIQRLCR